MAGGNKEVKGWKRGEGECDGEKISVLPMILPLPLLLLLLLRIRYIRVKIWMLMNDGRASPFRAAESSLVASEQPRKYRSHSENEISRSAHASSNPDAAVRASCAGENLVIKV